MPELTLYAVLQKAQPRWGVADLCKVHAKLEKVNITDVDSLSRVVMEGDLNSKLIALGERKLKSSTMAHLKTQVRSTYHAAQLARDPRTCFSSQCLLNGASKIHPASHPVSTILPEIGGLGAGRGGRQSSSNRRNRKRAVTMSTSAPPSPSSCTAVVRLPQVARADEKAGGFTNRKVQSFPLQSRLQKVSSEPCLPRQAAADHSYSFVANSCGASSSGSPSKSRTGVLNLPQVPGGMLPTDDNLEELLRLAHCHLKRGFAKPRPQNRYLGGVAARTIEEQTIYQAPYGEGNSWKPCREVTPEPVDVSGQCREELQEDEVEYSEPSGGSKSSAGYTFTEEEYSEDETCSYSSPQATRSSFAPPEKTGAAYLRKSTKSSYASDFDVVSDASSPVAQRQSIQSCRPPGGSSIATDGKELRRRSWINAYGDASGVGSKRSSRNDSTSLNFSAVSINRVPASGWRAPGRLSEGFIDV